MPQYNEKDSSSLYPKPKTFDELETERKLREAAHLPRFVSPKISLWATLGIVAVIVAYQSVVSVLTHNLSSEGGVISGVSFSMLIIVGAGAILFYCYSCISNLAAKVLTAPSMLFTALAVTSFITSVALAVVARHSNNSLVATIIVLVFNFLLVYIVAGFIVKYQDEGGSGR